MSLIYVNEFLLCALMFLFVLEPCNMQKQKPSGMQAKVKFLRFVLEASLSPRGINTSRIVLINLLLLEMNCQAEDS